MKIKIINGPNLNMLGIREPDVYGRQTYKDLVSFVENVCSELSVECSVYQSNHEGDIVTEIQNCYGEYDAIVINPAAYTHTSVAILDALKAVSVPTAEVHLSEVSEREDFRHFSYVSLYAEKVVTGKGFDGYKEAICYLVEKYK
ncbi:MAG: type II 3-dehydroquinate dehydratase [Ruminococcaceae bacterium]|nr:type II 3-dehydroquinate dehydratase [Oscillospiraceae bacterium]